MKRVYAAVTPGCGCVRALMVMPDAGDKPSVRDAAKELAEWVRGGMEAQIMAQDEAVAKFNVLCDKCRGVPPGEQLPLFG